jgi:hypothetical protein
MKPMAMRLNNKFVEVDPRQWKTQWDMIVNVGLGTGDKSQQLQHLGAIMEVQKLFLAGGKGHMVSDKNLFNAAAEMVENAGLKYVEAYFTDPSTVQPPPPQPNPEVVKIQAEMQAKQAEMKQTGELAVFEQQAATRSEQLKAQMDRYAADLKAQTDLQIAQMEAASKERIEQMKIRAEAEIAIFDANNEATIKSAEMQHTERVEGAKIQASSEQAAAQQSAKVIDMGAEREIREAVKTVAKIAESNSAENKQLRDEVAKIAQQSKKPKTRSGTFNGKPFQVTES